MAPPRRQSGSCATRALSQRAQSVQLDPTSLHIGQGRRSSGLDAAILAISVITLAEARYGYRNAGWGASRIEREERRLAGFLQIPLDLTIIDEWARLKVVSRQNGWNLADNDLWIAATASAREHPLVTCDGDQARIADPSLEVLHLPVSP